MSESPFNPFRQLSPAHRREVQRRRLMEARAKQQFDEVVAAYREIINDGRYAAIRRELEASLGAQLQQLMEKARGCSCCSPLAVRVDALSDIVARPLSQMWMEAQRTRMEEIAEPIADEL